MRTRDGCRGQRLLWHCCGTRSEFTKIEIGLNGTTTKSERDYFSSFRTNSGSFAIFAAILRASSAIPAIWPVIGVRRRNTNTPTEAAIKRPQRGSHGAASVVMMDRARPSLRPSGCTGGLFRRSSLSIWNRRRRNFITWNVAWYRRCCAWC